MVFVKFGFGNACGLFPCVWYCVGVKSCIVVDVCEVSDGKGVLSVSDV